MLIARHVRDLRLVRFLHSLYQVPAFLPTHQTTPIVAVCCSLLSTPLVSVKKDARFEKSRRHSYRIKNPSESL